MKKRIFAALLALMILAASGTSAHAAVFYYGETDLKYRTSGLGELIEEIMESYKDETDLDTLFRGVYKGLFAALGDEWSGYYPETASETLDLITEVEERYEGVGILMRKTDEGILITATVEDSPARNAGIRTGDYIVKVGATDVSGMTADEVALLIKGIPGSTVTLTVTRGGVAKDYTLTRAVIKNDTVSFELLEGGAGLIDIDRFTAGTAEEFREARASLIDRGAQSLIIDLRGNPGGLVSEAIDIADQMIPREGVITRYMRRGEVFETVRSTINDTKVLPCAVLTDENTASSSELLAAALKERGYARTVGTTTYGKGCAQLYGRGMYDDLFTLSLYYFLTPSGGMIDGVGIAPDVEVFGPSGYSEEDAQRIVSGLAPMTETTKYYAGQQGLNVYAAQQRLALLGYEVEATSVMDEATVEAVKVFQERAGGYPYGGLDYFTMNALNTAVSDFLLPQGEDVQLKAAVGLLAAE